MGPSFESQLCSTAWLPVLSTPPHPGMPWGERASVVAAPATVRPIGDAWLVSHCMGILDGDLASPYLWSLFGWHEPARPAVVCAQLAHFAGSFKEEVGPCGDELWRQLLRPAYAQLEGLVDTTPAAMQGVAAMLRARPCLWLGDAVGFVSPEHVAFDGGAGLEPGAPTLYVGVATAELREYEGLLRALGVRGMMATPAVASPESPAPSTRHPTPRTRSHRHPSHHNTTTPNDASQTRSRRATYSTPTCVSCATAAARRCRPASSALASRCCAPRRPI